MSDMTEAYDWQGRTVVGSNGEKIGKVDEVYLDQNSGKPEWATVKSGLFGSKSNFVPLASATTSGEDVSVQVTNDQVKDAPGVEADGELSQDEERKLFEHYNVPYTDEGSVTAQGAPQGQAGGDGAGHDTSGPDTDEAMTRSEEELHVGTRSVESGRVRLRKYVVTEMVTKTVPVQREEVRIEREPITDSNRDAALDGPEISEEEHEVVLHEDQVVVDKDVVAKERVKLAKETSAASRRSLRRSARSRSRPTTARAVARQRRRQLRARPRDRGRSCLSRKWSKGFSNRKWRWTDGWVTTRRKHARSAQARTAQETNRRASEGGCACSCSSSR